MSSEFHKISDNEIASSKGFSIEQIHAKGGIAYTDASGVTNIDSERMVGSGFVLYVVDREGRLGSQFSELTIENVTWALEFLGYRVSRERFEKRVGFLACKAQLPDHFWRRNRETLRPFLRSSIPGYKAWYDESSYRRLSRGERKGSYHVRREDFAPGR